MSRRSCVFVFLDGVGIGAEDPERNPFLSARLPTLRWLLDGRVPTLSRPRPLGADAAAFPLDARLDTEGTPRSGTGQVSLLTGQNAARLFGGHFGPWTPVKLRPLLARENLLVRAREAGLRVRFANAYPEGYLQRVSSRRVAAPTLAADAAGLLVRDHRALARGEAVASEIVNSGWRTHLGFGDLPEPTPTEAGAHLARIASGAELTLFAHYATDYAGHRGGRPQAVAALERVDAFLGGLLGALPEGFLLVVASDHGNVEELGRGHTTNPVLGLAAGPGAHELGEGLASIVDVAPALLDFLRVRRRPEA